MKQRILALLLMAAVALSLVGATALAVEGEPAPPDQSAAAQSGDGQPEGEGASSEETAAPAESDEAPQTAEDTETDGEAEEPEEEYIPDPVGSISFENLERRLRENNLNLLALEESIQAIEAIDYDEMAEDYREALNQIADQQWQMIQIPMLGSMMASSLDAQYDAIRQSFDDIKEGKLQRENADQVWMLENTQNQIIMAGETLYITLLDLETSARSLDRQLTALDRTLKELELRYQLGQISSQRLEQTRAGRTSLISGQQTMDTNISVLKTQLELFIGAEQSGKLRLGALPQVTAADLEAMNLEKDLAAAKEASYALYDAKLTLDDAKEAFDDAGRKYNYNEKRYEYQIAKHQWQASQHTYNAVVQDYELDFRTLYLQVKDYKQVLDAAKTALAVERDNYSVAQLKHEQGSLSDNALLDAEDKVTAAQETVDGAAIDLFTAYHNYRWAVDCGILN